MCSQLRFVVGVFVYIFSNQPQAVEANKDCFDLGFNDRSVFELSITLSFAGHVVFSLCNIEAIEKFNQNSERFLVVKVGESASIENTTTYKLNDAEFQKIYDLYDDALNFNVRDELLGPDGSNWCLRTTKGGKSLLACFWSPIAESKKRGLEGISKLGLYLWIEYKLYEKHGNLYES